MQKGLGRAKQNGKSLPLKLFKNILFTLLLCVVNSITHKDIYQVPVEEQEQSKYFILCLLCPHASQAILKLALMTTLMVLCLHLLYVGITGVWYHTGLIPSLKSRQNVQVRNIKLKLNTSNSEISVKLFSSDFSGFSLAHLLAASASSFSVSRLGLSNTYHK